MTIIKVRLGQPEEKSSYNIHETDGIRVYIQKGVLHRDKIGILLKGFLGFKRLSTTGLF